MLCAPRWGWRQRQWMELVPLGPRSRQIGGCGWWRETPTWSPYATAWAVTHGVLCFSVPEPVHLPHPSCRALWLSAALFLDFPIALRGGEAGERGLHCHPPRLPSAPIKVASPGVLVAGWPAGRRQFQQTQEWFSVQGRVGKCSCVALYGRGSPLCASGSLSEEGGTWSPFSPE